MRLLSKILLLLIIISFIGCSNPFDPSIQKSTKKGDFVYTNDTPDNVLRNIMLAYERKSLDIYKSTLDKDFVFHIVDQDQPQIGFNYWGYEQEIEFHKNLFSAGSSSGELLSPSYIYLNLMIPPESSWKYEKQANGENWVIITCFFNLTLNYSSQRPEISANGYARFHLKSIDGKWYIAVWMDESFI